jgi:NitT/TauT family transport system ATP-binding protein
MLQVDAALETSRGVFTDDAGFLSLEQVSKVFPRRSGALRVVDAVSFAAPRREVTVLLGPSGCGKSTILRMVAGLDSTSSGRILLEGNVITGPGRDRGMVFQSYTSFPWLTVRGNVEYGLRINGETIAIAEGAADYFLDRVRLTKFRDAYPDQLSGGMRQRVALARALATYPRMLLMDEPFGALDAETRWQMQELLMDVVSREQMTVLLVTHDIDEALFLADQIVFLSSHPGRVREVLRPAWNAGGRIATKEALYDQQDYQSLSRHVMRLMREEGVTH